MYFDSWSEVLEMGGHGPYVWSVYLITLLVLAYLAWSPVARHRRQLRNILRKLDIEQSSAQEEN